MSDDRRAGEVLRRLRALLTKEAPESKPLDVKSTLEEILQLVRSDVVMRRIALEVELAPDLPPVRGDRVQLQQVALNLLINAFEAVQDLDVERRRVVLQAAGQDGHVVISVVDQGRGVPRGRDGPRLRAVLHDQARRHGPGPAHLPDDRRLPRRRAGGRAQRRRGDDLLAAAPGRRPPEPRRAAQTAPRRRDAGEPSERGPKR